jgi:hypothetical protein
MKWTTMKAMRTVLVVEDELKTARLIRDCLELDLGFRKWKGST